MAELDNPIDLFDSVRVLNMERRQDRLDKFDAQIDGCDWPFRCPERYAAVDGWKLPVPDGFKAGNGGWGCLLGHRGMLQESILAEHKSVLIMEDDAIFRPTFANEFEMFYKAVPDDWEFLFIGGQHNGSVTKINEHVAKVNWANRFHCYAVRGKMIRDLYQKLISVNGHCDLEVWPWLAGRKVYCPHPRFLAGQGAGWSDICSSDLTPRFWSPAPADVPVVYLRAPRGVAEELFKRGLLHPGYKRDGNTGVDKWLKGLVNQHGLAGKSFVAAVSAFLHGLKGEAANEAGGKKLACLWHPQIAPAVGRQCCGTKIIEIEASTVEDAVAKLERERGSNGKAA